MINKIEINDDEDLSDIGSIIACLNFLIRETNNSGLTSISNILRRALSDITILLSKKAEECDEENNKEFYEKLLSPPLYAAIEFLSLYASIDDKEIRQEIIDKLEYYHFSE